MARSLVTAVTTEFLESQKSSEIRNIRVRYSDFYFYFLPSHFFLKMNPYRVQYLYKRLALEIFRNKLFSLKWRRKAPSPFAKELLQADLARQILVTVLTALQSGSTRCLHYILSQCYH